MRELTNELPKPMLKVQGKPILEHIVEGILAAGIREICIVTGFRADVIRSHFADGKKWDARIVYGRQEVQDGTGKIKVVTDDNDKPANSDACHIGQCSNGVASWPYSPPSGSGHPI